MSIGNDPLNPCQANMEIVTREWTKNYQFQSAGAAGQGNSFKGGVAYRIADGSLIYVPE